jgi:hypothetical protein
MRIRPEISAACETIEDLRDSDFTFIYGLVDPRNGQIRYVGMTDRPKFRLKSHMECLESPTSYKTRWIRKLKKENVFPLLVILDKVHKSQRSEKERFWIAHVRSLGFHLTNGTEGGEGGRQTEDVRLRMSLVKSGKKRGPYSEEHRKRISEALKGKKYGPRGPLSEETKHKISIAQKGHKDGPPSQEHRDKISKALTGKPKSEEHIRRVSEALTGKRGRVAWNKGKSPSDEARAAMSKSQKKAWAEGKYANKKRRKDARN